MARIRRLLVSGVLVALFWCAASLLAWNSPLRSELLDAGRFARPHDSLVVVDRHGTPLRAHRSGGVDRRWVELRDVSPHLVDAVIAAEDERFRAHGGVDPKAITRALMTSYLPWRKRSGASTITQQTVKLVYGRRAWLLSKVLEMPRAVVLEEQFSKDEILEQYLNRVPFGDRIEGVARASEEYFGRPVSSLTVSEAALLAGIPQAPSINEPRRHLARALERRAYVLGRMREMGAIDEDTFRTAMTERPAIQSAPAHPYAAPRFADSALAAWKRGDTQRTAGELRTTLDLSLQKSAEEILASAVSQFSSRGVSNGAAIVLANESGEVLAHVGAARQGPEHPGGELDLAARKRQPGSTLKPFVYELFFEQGANPATVVDDIAVPMTGAKGEFFEARDYDGTERGPVRARIALASSLNLAALDASRRVGADRVLHRLSRLGVRLDGDSRRYGAAVVLGGADVSVSELARAYLALARGGSELRPTMFPRGAMAGQQVMQPDGVALVTDVLSDGRARAEAFGQDLEALDDGRKMALKTGTSSGWRDAWTAAYDDLHTVVVWLGDPWGRPLRGVSGFEAAAPAAVRILAQARDRAGENAVQPIRLPEVRLVRIEVCASTGLRVGPRCAHRVSERFSAAEQPTQTCDRHDDRGNTLLPPRFEEWVRRARPAGAKVGPGEVHDDAAPLVRFPQDGAKWLVDPVRGDSEVALRAATHGVENADVAWEIDGTPIAGNRWRLVVGQHEVVARWRGRASKPARIQVVLPP